MLPRPSAAFSQRVVPRRPRFLFLEHHVRKRRGTELFSFRAFGFARLALTSVIARDFEVFLKTCLLD